ncbi:hypothetical protein QFZ53_000528 [Microbacterium natoriense]|uniref:DUF4262 domain-containing protein n=1 Tax=Microbacterium natoriense TaxID=284570 RepID=A0AAW8ET73_9MICO|nr:hypothetical protein [Microbacterium natoriense]MDQ0646332.1 hypothetical protein [Microbacterium natoriense]
MTNSSEDAVSCLLAGPRGRRLCLQYALNVSPSIGTPLFQLSHRAAPQSSALLIIGDGEPAEEPDYTLEHLAELITSIAVPPPSGETLHAALRDSVDAARYWQEPDGADVVATHPAVLASLAGIARAIVASPVAASWDSPSDPQQWAVDWRAAADAGPLPTNAARLLTDWDRDRREDEKRAPRESPRDVQTIFTGTWWSLPMSLLQTRGSVRAALELYEDSFGPEAATVIPVRGTGRICEIRSAEDWARLCLRYPVEVTASRRHDWYRVTGRDGRWIIPDWTRVAADWDAVHLTVLGYLSAATRLIPVDDEYASVIGGWAPDSTVWLTDSARESAPRQHWARPDGRSEWIRQEPGADGIRP